MRHQLDAPILAHRQIGDCEFEMVLHAPAIAAEARAGQFLQVLYDHSLNPYTRRPFSVFKVDAASGAVTIVYLSRGAFTRGLARQRVGDRLSIVGPLGNRFVPSDAPGVRHILVAGGVGAPPITLLAWEMVRDGAAPGSLVVINGARTRSQLVGVREFEDLGVDLRLVTDDGSAGRRGIVTDVLRELLDPRGAVQVYACGPTAMLRAVSGLCIERGAPCLVSVETMMPCGLGVCMGCAVKIRDASHPDGYRMLRGCHDGPVFRGEDVLWD